MTVSYVTPEQARVLQQQGVALIDIRGPDEWMTGIAQAARTVSKSDLEQQACRYIEGPESPVILICAGGKRSDACSAFLSGQGYQNLYSVVGGTQAWKDAGLPMQAYQINEYDLRYSRQMLLPNVGRDGQALLSAAKVLIVGAGGLGSPCAYYLAAAGVGTLHLLDDDSVELSNLQRQIMHSTDKIGQSKVSSAKSTLLSLNPSIIIEPHQDKITSNNAIEYIKNVDLVIDGTDNFIARYAISDACTALGIPLIYGAVYRFEGQVSVFNASKKENRTLCYRCLFPEAEAASAPNCTEAGVLGVAPGIIGLLQATEALKWLLNTGTTLQGRLLHVDLLAMRFRETTLTADPACASCGPKMGS